MGAAADKIPTQNANPTPVVSRQQLPTQITRQQLWNRYIEMQDMITARFNELQSTVSHFGTSLGFYLGATTTMTTSTSNPGGDQKRSNITPEGRKKISAALRKRHREKKAQQEEASGTGKGRGKAATATA